MIVEARRFCQPAWMDSWGRESVVDVDVDEEEVGWRWGVGGVVEVELCKRVGVVA